MSFSLYAATVPSYLQILGSIIGMLEKAETFCTEHSIAPHDIIQARLVADMHPFAYQIKSAAVHSLGALEGVRHGAFSPDTTAPPADFAALTLRISSAIADLESVEPQEVESFIGRDMKFVFGTREITYTAENFLLSFSQPNFYFHATTSYDILRWKKVPVGKRDFLGKVRAKRAL